MTNDKPLSIEYIAYAVHAMAYAHAIIQFHETNDTGVHVIDRALIVQVIQSGEVAYWFDDNCKATKLVQSNVIFDQGRDPIVLDVQDRPSVDV